MIRERGREEGNLMANGYNEVQKNHIHEGYSKLIKDLMKRGLPDTKLLNDAFRFAMEKHSGVFRRSGEPYMEHPLAVAQILVDLGFESDMVAAALLHDVIEDCDVKVEELTERFGKPVADIVDALSAVNAATGADSEMAKSEIDILSDVKLLRSIEEDPKALYIKLADRIHNLRTIGVFPYTKQREKAQHTRTILIPLAKRMGVFQLVDILEDLCFQIENPDCYRIVNDKYNNLLQENRYALKEIQDYLTEVFYGPIQPEDDRMAQLSKFIASCSFYKRYKESIFRNITSKVTNILMELGDSITKEYLELYDIYFIVKDDCGQSALDIFFSFYPKLLNSQYRITITGIQKNYERTHSYFILEDCYNIKYRLFIEKQQEYLNSMHGIILADNSADLRNMLKINMADPSDSFRAYINVYRKDGTMMQIEEGATVLDFAFAIHAEIGICAKYALLNKKQEQVPLYTKLNEGDMVEIVHDANKNNPEKDIPHATIRWFEYVRTRGATKALSRYLETHIESAKPLIQVHDDKNNTYEIETGSTVLDFAFLLGDQVGLHFKNAYLNASSSKARIDKMLRYDDIIAVEYNVEDKDTPEFEWLNIVKTQRAKQTLINYFNNQFKKRT